MFMFAVEAFKARMTDYLAPAQSALIGQSFLEIGHELTDVSEINDRRGDGFSRLETGRVAAGRSRTLYHISKSFIDIPE